MFTNLVRIDCLCRSITQSHTRANPDCLMFQAAFVSLFPRQQTTRSPIRSEIHSCQSGIGLAKRRTCFSNQFQSQQHHHPIRASLSMKTGSPLDSRDTERNLWWRAIQRRLQRERRRRKVGRAYDMALEIARVLPAKARVLDVGCGSGFIAHHLSAMLGQSVVGIDLEEHTEAAIDYRQFDGKHLPLDDSSVDAVLLCYVLHHAQDVNKVMSELRRVLGGQWARGYLRRHSCSLVGSHGLLDAQSEMAETHGTLHVSTRIRMACAFHSGGFSSNY